MNVSRRRLLQSSAGAALIGATSLVGSVQGEEREKQPRESTDKGPAVRHGRIKQSIVQWCFADHWDVPQQIKVAQQLGCGSIELLDAKYFPLLKKAGLECAIGTIDMSPDPPFVKGLNNPKYKDRVFAQTKAAIDACREYGFKRVICFTGMAEDLSADEGADNCVKHLKELAGYAEKADVTLCLEMLNTREDTHPMKGHPGYQGNHTEYCIDILQRVGSSHAKLLFDIYHVQIMDGDVIRRLHQHKDFIGHIHTAGNPGRGELDDKQEINYPPIMQALLDIGYDGYVGQEFIPTRDPLAGLRQAVSLCDV